MDALVSDVMIPGHRSGLPEGLRDFGVSVAAAALDSFWDDKVHLLSSAERAGIERAVPKRQREIIAGRVLAQALLRRFGRAGVEVPRREDRCPEWPMGLVGSITHTDTVCAVALGQEASVRALGIDLEAREPLDTDVWPLLCRPSEQERALRSPEPGIWIRWMFCAKEAYYKAQFPHTGRFIEARELEVRLDPERGRFSVGFADAPGAGPADRPFLSGTGLLTASDTSLGAAWIVEADTGARAGGIGTAGFK